MQGNSNLAVSIILYIHLMKENSVKMHSDYTAHYIIYVFLS